MFKKLKNLLCGKLPESKLNDKVVLVKFPPVCITCEKEMDSLRINRPFCDECLNIIKDVINKKNKKNERKSKKI
jgi:hypothetical protein